MTLVDTCMEKSKKDCMRDLAADRASSDSGRSMEQPFAGKRALVVGGSGGIGAAICRQLARQGLSRLTVHGGHQSSRFAALVNELYDIKEASAKETASGLSLSTLVQEFSTESFSSLPQSLLATYARECDILCVCYGPFLQKPLEAMTAADWAQTALLDYALPGFLVSAAIPGMKQRGWGRILLFGGTGTESRREFMTNAAYAGAKTAVGTLVQSTAAAYASYGITCNALLPGFTQTEYTGTAAAGLDSASALAKKMPGGRLLEADSLARTALFLLENPDINGALLRCDRGWSPLA